MRSAAGELYEATLHSPHRRRRNGNPSSFRKLRALIEVALKVGYLFRYLLGWEATETHPSLQVRLASLGEVT